MSSMITIIVVLALFEGIRAFQCTNYGNASSMCGGRAVPPLEALCLAHCYACKDDGTLGNDGGNSNPGGILGNLLNLRKKRQETPIGALGDVPQPVAGLPSQLTGAAGVPRGAPLQGIIGPLSLNILQRCLLECIVSLNVLGDCNVNAIVTELLTICPHANLEVCCLSACTCCSNDDASTHKCLDVCLQYLPPKVSVNNLAVAPLGNTFDIPLLG